MFRSANGIIAGNEAPWRIFLTGDCHQRSRKFGRIAGLLEAVEPAQAPLQRRLAVFGRQLAVAILAICAVFFALGIWRGEPLLLMLLTALSLAVAAIPEAKA